MSNEYNCFSFWIVLMSIVVYGLLAGHLPNHNLVFPCKFIFRNCTIIATLISQLSITPVFYMKKYQEQDLKHVQ